LIENQRRFVSDRISHLSDLEEDVEPCLFFERLTRHIQFIDDLALRQKLCIGRLIDIKQALLDANAGKLNTVSPLGTLSRGYGITLKLPGKTLVQSIEDVERSDEVSITVSDGKITCNVNNKEGCKWK
jgi:exodeoxyribonuclease VII large subunit